MFVGKCFWLMIRGDCSPVRLVIFLELVVFPIGQTVLQIHYIYLIYNEF